MIVDWKTSLHVDRAVERITGNANLLEACMFVRKV